jgi:hypothetical protein
VVSAGKLRELWDSLNELRSSLCGKMTGKDSSVACAIACQNCAVYSVFSIRYDVKTVKSLSLTDSVLGAYDRSNGRR